MTSNAIGLELKVCKSCDYLHVVFCTGRRSTTLRCALSLLNQVRMTFESFKKCECGKNLLIDGVEPTGFSRCSVVKSF